jgi:hypothetical protein
MAQNITEAEGTTRATVELPDSLWEAAKLFAIRERVSFKDLLINALREYLTKRRAA